MVKLFGRTIGKVNSLPESDNKSIPKVNSANQRPASRELYDENRVWNDSVKLYMPENIVENRVNMNNPTHRYHQTLKNPYFYKNTFQIFKRILGKRPNRPYPFEYVNLFYGEENGNKNGNISEVSQRNGRESEEGRKPSRSKYNSLKTDSGNASSENMEFANGNDNFSGNKTKNQYTKRVDLNSKIHAMWDKEGLWDVLIDCLSYACGVNSCAILKTVGSNGENKYWVIPRNFFVKGYTRNRVLTKIVVRWSNWFGIEEEGLGVPFQSEETYEIGDDFILCTPFPSFESPYGEPMLQAFWSTGIYKEFLRLLQMMFYWKGGIVANYERIPVNMDQEDIDEMKKEYRKGILSELHITKVSQNSNPETVDKLFNHESVYGSGMNFEVGNSILSEDSLFPKQFIEGEATSGALGGDSGDINKQEIDDTMFYYFYTAIEKLVKDINKVFLGIEDSDYTIIPFEIDDPVLGKDVNNNGIPDIDENVPLSTKNNVGDFKKEKKANSISFIKNTDIKVNSSDIKCVFEGFALIPTAYEQDDGSYEYLEAEEIEKYVNDPKSVKEFYFKDEHPLDNPMEIKKDDASGKIVITGYDTETGGAKAIAYLFEDVNVNELYLSPSYYSHDVRKDNKIYHSDIDLRNIVSTTRARAGKNIKLNKKI